MSILIIEGTDSCGKTSIAKEFCKQNNNYEYFKVKQEQMHIEKLDPLVLKHAHELQMNFFYELARQTTQNIVMDRFYPSEYVYGSLFRKIDEQKLWEFDEMFASLDTKIIICVKEDDKLEDRLWSKEQLIAIKKKYQEFAKKTKCKVLILQTDSEDLKDQLNKIDTFLLS